jgi:hypothetical protein
VKRKWVGHVSSVGKKINIYIILVENTKESRPTGKSSCRLEGNIKKNRKERCLEDVKYSFSSEEGSVAGSHEHNNEVSGYINGG